MSSPVIWWSGWSGQIFPMLTAVRWGWLVCLCLSIVINISKADLTTTFLSYNVAPIETVLYREVPVTYCVKPDVALHLFGLQSSDSGGNANFFSGLYNMLEETVIMVATVSPADVLTWHSVRGISTDDLHTLLETAIWKAFSYSPPSVDKGPVQSIIRDIFSACPSPLFSSSRSICHMPFSTFGTSCVTLSSENDVSVTIRVSKHFNRRLFYHFLVGLSLIAFAYQLAKSKIFHVRTTI